jgi:RNA polymerase sigma-70 factor (ECF subfamily)
MARSRARAAEAPDAAFGHFYRVTWPDVVAYCAGLLGDRGAGEEVAQESFARLYPRWGRVDDPRPYVFRIAGNLCGRHRHARSRLTGMEAAGDTPTPGDETSRLLVEAAVARLPLRLRQALLLHYYADLAVADVAHVLGRPPGTVKRQLHDARTALAADLGDLAADPEGDRDGTP